MPLIKREVEPVFVSQVDIGKDVKEELECVTNYTLASIIRQLSNLGKHAEDIFGDLLQEATSLANRAKSVQDRMDKISDTISKLDPLTDAVSLRDINTRMAFRSSLVLDVEVVSSPTMPSAMKETYTRCQQPPALSKLNQFRQDQKDGLKFYTDPKFFFERWKKEQHEDIETKTKKKKRKKRPHSSNVSKPKKVLTTKEKYKDHALGQEFVEMERARKAKEKNSSDTTSPTKEDESRAEDRSEKRDSQEASPQHTPKRATPDSVRKPGKAPPPAPPPPMPVSNGGVVDDSSAMSLPPPPPMDDDSTYSEVGEMPPPPPTLTGNIAPPPPASPNAPPVPPPPPVPSSAGPAPPPPPPLPAAGGPPLPPATPTPRQTSVSSNPRPPTAVSQVTGSRDDLLSAIKQGMQLRRVDIKVKDKRNEPENNSVEAILRRRIAVELSSDEETGSEVSGDSDWDDDED